MTAPQRVTFFLAAVAIGTVGAAQQRIGPEQKRASHQRMVRTLAEIAERAKSEHKYHGDAAAKQLWAELETLGAKAGWQLRLEAALAHLRLGNTRDGIAMLERAHEALQKGAIEGDDGAKNSIRFYIGVAWLRLAETDNCCARNTPESCILPLRGGALHTAKEGSTNAIPWLLEVIANTPPGDY